MRTINHAPILFLFFLMPFSCQSDPVIRLFNGKNLENWTVYVGTPDLDPEELFYVEEGMINTTGEPFGYIRTRDSYQNFKLHVEWRWVDEPTNSGVLLLVQDEEMIWPNAIECQLMNEHAGDLVCIGKGAGLTAGDSTYLVTSDERRYAVVPKMEAVSELPAGEWNRYDITLNEGEIEVRVNGVLQNKGSGITLKSGKIALQSEGSPLQFRNITLEPL